MPFPSSIPLATGSGTNEAPATTLPIFLLQKQVETIHSAPRQAAATTYMTPGTRSSAPPSTGMNMTDQGVAKYEDATLADVEQDVYQADNYAPPGGDAMSDPYGNGYGIYPNEIPISGDQLAVTGCTYCHWILAAAIALGLMSVGLLIKGKK
jgi:hypothetical protein